MPVPREQSGKQTILDRSAESVMARRKILGPAIETMRSQTPVERIRSLIPDPTRRVLDVAGKIASLASPSTKGSGTALAVGHQMAKVNAPLLRIQRMARRLNELGSKNSLTQGEVNFAKKIISDLPSVKKFLSKFQPRKEIKFVAPIKGRKPPTQKNKRIPESKTFGALAKEFESLGFRSKLDAVRAMIKRGASRGKSTVKNLEGKKLTGREIKIKKPKRLVIPVKRRKK